MNIGLVTRLVRRDSISKKAVFLIDTEYIDT